MELHAYTRTISELLSVNKKYVVPRFQREYSWVKEQINELWIDTLSNIKYDEETNSYSWDEYFIGSLVLIGDDTDNSMQIVDGQQRLTTLTILLSVLCQRFVEIDKEPLAQALYDNYIAGKDDDGEYFFKLVNESPKPFFQNNIQHIVKKGEQPETNEEKTLISAYSELYNLSAANNISSLLNKEIKNNDEYELALKAIREQVVRYLKVIFITVNEEDEAYTIFETLNARGMNLSYVDLIKNKIFKELNGSHPDDDAKTKWNKIRKIIASRSGIGSMEQFMRHWWMSNHSYVSSENLYKAFIKKWRKGEINAAIFLDELLDDAETYLKIASPMAEDFPQQEDKLILRSLQALKLFNITQNRPFLMSLLKAKSKGTLRHADLLRAFSTIEKFHLAFNAVCSLRPSGIEGSYSKAARALSDNSATKQKNAQAIDSLLDTLRGRFPERDVFIDKFKSIKFNNKETKQKKLIQYIFASIEKSRALTDEFLPDLISIEHIMPQSVGNLEEASMIGNLLPLSKELNERAGNKSINAKLAIYHESQFLLVQQFLGSYDPTQGAWSKSEILANAALYASELYDLNSI
ncbi:DUF262 domain-containing HNH endonuclease family protein [Serratia fonticola]